MPYQTGRCAVSAACHPCQIMTASFLSAKVFNVYQTEVYVIIVRSLLHPLHFRVSCAVVTRRRNNKMMLIPGVACTTGLPSARKLRYVSIFGWLALILLRQTLGYWYLSASMFFPYQLPIFAENATTLSSTGTDMWYLMMANFAPQSNSVCLYGDTHLRQTLSALR